MPQTAAAMSLQETHSHAPGKPPGGLASSAAFLHVGTSHLTSCYASAHRAADAMLEPLSGPP